MTRIYLTDAHGIYCTPVCLPASRMRWVVEQSPNEVVDTLLKRACCDACGRRMLGKGD